MNPALAVKQYSRSSADQEVPLPHELRPVSVLQMTMTYLMTKIMNLCDSPDVRLYPKFKSHRKRSPSRSIWPNGSTSFGTERAASARTSPNRSSAARIPSNSSSNAPDSTYTAPPASSPKILPFSIRKSTRRTLRSACKPLNICITTWSLNKLRAKMKRNLERILFCSI